MIDISRVIPHRPPFLFVDRALELDDNRIVAEKHLSPGLDFFKGHYPGFPLLPGVLALEAIFQAGAILIGNRILAGEPLQGVPALTRIRDAKFRRMVRPGDTLRLEVALTERAGPAFLMKGSATVDGEVAVNVIFTCALVKIDGFNPLEHMNGE
jgi:3-hydroxyacyl-[acyl-carrier-protein] dehydratase